MADSVYQHFHPDEHDFIDKVRDWRQQAAEWYQLVVTPFLNPREQYIVKTVIGHSDDLTLAFSGGFPGAENQRAVLAPPYTEVQWDDFQIRLLSLKYNAVFGTLSHGAILGTLLGTGIVRNRLGDIVQQVDAEGHVAWQVAVDRALADFLIQAVTRIGRSTVLLSPIDKDVAFTAAPDWQTRESAVSSFRLDALLAEGFHLSRAKTKALIEKELAKVNWAVVSDPATTIEAYDIMSLRGHGRMRLDSVVQRTKKGNFWIRYSVITSK